MRVKFDVRHSLAPKDPSLAAGRVYGQFGLDVEQGERVYVEPFDIDVDPGQIVAFVGVSGSGKTSCLRQFQSQTDAYDIEGESLTSDKTVIEQLAVDGDIKDAMEKSASCGLAEAQLFLRYPQELSDGQQYRFRMASALSKGARVLVCDEFLAKLDRTSAKVIAFNIRKLVTREKLTLAIATTHEDLLEDLAPDYLVRFDGKKAQVEVRDRPKVPKESHFSMICTLRGAIELTGNDSPTGTTEVIASG